MIYQLLCISSSASKARAPVHKLAEIDPDFFEYLQREDRGLLENTDLDSELHLDRDSGGEGEGGEESEESSDEDGTVEPRPLHVTSRKYVSEIFDLLLFRWWRPLHCDLLMWSVTSCVFSSENVFSHPLTCWVWRVKPLQAEDKSVGDQQKQVTPEGAREPTPSQSAIPGTKQKTTAFV